MANFAWARWLVLGSAPLVGLGLIVAVWSIVASHRHRKAAVEPPAKAVAVQSPQGVPKPPPSLPNPRLDRRWLPDRTALVFSVHAKQLASQPQAEKSIRQLELLGHVPIDALLRSLGLTLDGVQRLTWAASDLAIWPERSVVVLELAPDHNTDALAAQRRSGRRGHRRFGLPPPARRYVAEPAAGRRSSDDCHRRRIAAARPGAAGRRQVGKPTAGPAPGRGRSRCRCHVVGRSGGGQGGPLETAHGPLGRVAAAETPLA